MILKFNKFIKENLNSDKNVLLFYSFDWDDNILMMPTKIIMDKLIDGEWVETPVSTQDFAKIRGDKENWRLSDNNPDKAFGEFRDFGPRGDKAFLLDVKEAISLGKLGPSFNDFIECIKSGSLFSIITARGHESNSIRMAVEWMIDNYLTDSDKYEMYNNLLKFNYLFRGSEDVDRVLKGDPTDNEVVKNYLDNCDFVGVSSPSRGGTPDGPEKAKELALIEFKTKIDKLSRSIGFKSMIGFSDDDKGNVKHITDLFDNIDNERFPSIIKYIVKDTSDPNNMTKKVRVIENRSPGMNSSTSSMRKHSHINNKISNFSNWDSTSRLSSDELGRISDEVGLNKESSDDFEFIKNKYIDLEKNNSIDIKHPDLENHLKKLDALRSESEPKKFIYKFKRLTGMTQWDLPDELYRFM